MNCKRIWIRKEFYFLLKNFIPACVDCLSLGQQGLGLCPLGGLEAERAPHSAAIGLRLHLQSSPLAPIPCRIAAGHLSTLILWINPGMRTGLWTPILRSMLHWKRKSYKRKINPSYSEKSGNFHNWREGGRHTIITIFQNICNDV